MDLHDQLEGQRRHAQIGLVHVEDHAAEVVGVVQRRVGAVDRLHRVARAGVRERRGTRGAAIEVDGLHVGVAHGAGAAALRHIEVTVVGAVFVLAGLLVAAGAGAHQRVLQVLPALDDLAADGIQHDHRAGGPGRCRIGDEGHRVRQMALAGVVDVNDQVRLLVTGQHPRDAIAQCEALGSHQRGGLAELRGGRGDVGLEAGDQVAEHGPDVAVAILADDHALAEHRDATPCLVVAVVADASVLAGGAHQQGAVGVGAHELRMAAVRHRGDALRRGERLVLLAQLVDVALVQVGPLRRVGAGSGEREQDGGTEEVGSAETVHWRLSLGCWLSGRDRGDGRTTSQPTCVLLAWTAMWLRRRCRYGT